MKLPAIFAFLAALLAGAAPAFGGGAITSTCQNDDEITAPTRSAIAAAAWTFADAMLTGKADSALDDATEAVRTDATARAGVGEIAGHLASIGPYTDLKNERLYFLSTSGTGEDQRVVCGPLGDDEWVSVNATPGKIQAHAVLSANTINNGWSITEWLIQENGAWRVQYFHINAQSAAGYSFRKMFEMAETERKAGHTWNAALFYHFVQSLIDRGTTFQLGFVQTFRDRLKDVAIVPELAATPSTTWVLNGHSYTVRSASIMGIAKQLGVVVDLPQSDWPSDAEIDRRNRAFIGDLRAVHPELAGPFAFIVARGLKPDGSGGFATVYEEGKGFD